MIMATRVIYGKISLYAKDSSKFKQCNQFVTSTRSMNLLAWTGKI